MVVVALQVVVVVLVGVVAVEVIVEIVAVLNGIRIIKPMLLNGEIQIFIKELAYVHVPWYVVMVGIAWISH